MEILRHTKIPEKTRSRKLRFSALAAAALTLAACSGNMPQNTETLAREIHSKSAQGGRQYIDTFIVRGVNDEAQTQLEANGGVSVRGGEASTKSPSFVMGKITPGISVHGGDRFDSGQGIWVAISCLNPAIDKAGRYHENTDFGGFKKDDMCYLSADFVKPVK